MMDWIFLFVVGLCEMVFVVMLKLLDGFKKVGYVILMIIFMFVSFFLLFFVFKMILIGIGYVIWIGIGVVGSVIFGMIVFKECKSVGKLFFIMMIIVGVVGLKLIFGV